MTPAGSERADAQARALVIVPTYNESANIEEVARRLFAATGDSADLLVIDDGSPDGTADVVRAVARGPHRVHLLERAGKQGLGSAYLAGFRWGIERGYRALVEMDADLSHDPADVPRLLRALEDADLAIGSRYVPDGRVENWSKTRRALSGGGNLYARAWLRFGVRDSTSGFRAYRADALRSQDLSDVRSEGYAFQIEMAWRIYRAGGRVAEVPIVFVERAHGRSKMSKRIVVEALTAVPRWALTDRRARGGGAG
ncbi:MAG: polyprenol monophosphomannose synthase [Actinomycetota bacterium]